MNLPLRARLTAWYFFILAASFLAFGLIADVGIRHSIDSAVNDSLRSKTSSVRYVIGEAKSEGAAEVPRELEEFAKLRTGGLLLKVTGGSGATIYEAPELGRIRDRSPGDAQREFRTIEIDDQQYRAARERFEIDGESFQIEVAASTEAFDQAIDRFRLIEWLVAPLLLVLASAGGYWMSRRALSPVDEIIRSARNIGGQNLAERLIVPRAQDELRRLTETLNEMLARLDAAFRRITQFTADASHELRTPVALMRTSAELALRKPRTEGEYREALEQVLAASERTSALIENLLELARADAGAAVLQRTSGDLREPVRAAVRQAGALAAAKSLHFSEQIPGEPVRAVADAPAIERLTLILLDNAVKYTPAGGKVDITLTTMNGVATITVRDSGEGISGEDLPHIFDRFYRADKARSGVTGGAGLGLSIGRWIAEAHGGTIQARSTSGSGAIFEARIPIEP